MPRLINWELAGNPVNWAIVALMVLTATFGLSLLLGEAGGGAGSGVDE